MTDACKDKDVEEQQDAHPTAAVMLKPWLWLDVCSDLLQMLLA
jgi:hypothetical protein